MSEQELNRTAIVGQVLEKIISVKTAAEKLQISYRQAKRLVKNMRQNGITALTHKHRGKPNVRRFSKEQESKIINIVNAKYRDFGPTFAAEKLASIDNIKISNESLRQIMTEYGLWIPKQRKIHVHQLRARRPQYGELIQIDGSHHDWFEGRAPKCVALVFVDDATSRLQLVHFCKSEDLHGYFTSMKQYVEKYGCPREIYTDKHSVFTINHMRGGEKKGRTQFAKMLQELNIKQNLANSPQAKGRVERMNRVLQDRLVKDFRLAQISCIKKANDFMGDYVIQHNKNFAKVAHDTIDAHTALSESQLQRIDRTFAVKDTRTVSKALTVQYRNAIYVIKNVRAIRTLIQRGVKIYELLDGTIKMYSSGQELSFDLLEYVSNHIEPASRKELDIIMDANKFAEVAAAANTLHQAINVNGFLKH